MSIGQVLSMCVCACVSADVSQQILHSLPLYAKIYMVMFMMHLIGQDSLPLTLSL